MHRGTKPALAALGDQVDFLLIQPDRSQPAVWGVRFARDNPIDVKSALAGWTGLSADARSVRLVPM